MSDKQDIEFADDRENAMPRECYETRTEIIVLGIPDDDHNCDKMGCATIGHVRYRFKKDRADQKAEAHIEESKDE